MSTFTRSSESYAPSGDWLASQAPELASHGRGAGIMRARIARHKAELEKKLGRPVALAVAIADLAHQAGELDRPLVLSQERYLELLRRCQTDSKTGLLNFAAFASRLADEIQRAKRYQQSLSLIMMDLDGLKRVNDRYGHLAGDEAIGRLVLVIGDSVRASDISARYGGDEFAILTPHTDGPSATQLAERIVARARRALAPWGAGLSAGVASCPGSGSSCARLVHAADAALYRSKSDGGNCVRAAPGILRRQIPA